MTTTPLDNAYATAMSDSNRQNEFYGLLLETELYFPVIETDPAKVSEVPDANSDTLSPVLLDIEGAPVLPIFDTQERLADWAEGTEMRFGGMPGYAIVEMAAAQDPVVQIAFNVGQESFHHMVVEEVSWLNEAWQSMREAIDMDADAEISLAVPADDYRELKDALVSRMETMPEIERAYVVLVEGLSEDVPRDICVVLEVAEAAEGNRIAEELVPTAAAHEPAGESVVISGNQPRILAFAQSETQPFYQRLAA
jgi:hypothetical protein